MSYIGIPWDEQKTVRGKMRTVVSQFLRNFSNASEDDWEVFFRESERHLRRFAKYTVRYNDLPRAEEIYHQLVADLKDKFALSEERTYDSFRAVLYEFFRGRLIDDMRRSATVTKHSGGVEQYYRMLHRRDETPFADDGGDYGDTDFVGMCRAYIEDNVVHGLSPLARDIYGITDDERDVWVRVRIKGETEADIARERVAAGVRGCSKTNICDEVRKVDGYLQAEMRKFRDFRG